MERLRREERREASGQVTHPLLRMARTNETHYSTKNWSDRFVCLECGNTRRHNLNYLGSRRTLYCDGENMTVAPCVPGPTYFVPKNFNRKEG